MTKKREQTPVLAVEPREEPAAEAEAASFGAVYARLADSVTVAGANPPGTLSPSSGW